MNNCLFWALGQWLKNKGKIRFVKSKYWVWGFHTIWSKDGVTWLSYEDPTPKRKWLPPILFKGVVKEYNKNV